MKCKPANQKTEMKEWRELIWLKLCVSKNAKMDIEKPFFPVISQKKRFFGFYLIIGVKTIFRYDTFPWSPCK